VDRPCGARGGAGRARLVAQGGHLAGTPSARLDRRARRLLYALAGQGIPVSAADRPGPCRPGGPSLRAAAPPPPMADLALLGPDLRPGGRIPSAGHAVAIPRTAACRHGP